MTTTNVAPTPDRLLTVRDVANLTGQSVSTLNRARVYGTSNAPAYIKIGKSVRYRLSTVQKWIADQTEYRHTTEQQAAAC